MRRALACARARAAATAAAAEAPTRSAAVRTIVPCPCVGEGATGLGSANGSDGTAASGPPRQTMPRSWRSRMPAGSTAAGSSTRARPARTRDARLSASTRSAADGPSGATVATGTALEGGPPVQYGTGGGCWEPAPASASCRRELAASRRRGSIARSLRVRPWFSMPPSVFQNLLDARHRVASSRLALLLDDRALRGTE